MRSLFLILVLCSPSIAQDKPEPPALTAARKEYETGINLAKRVHESTLEKLAKTYREKLAEIVEERTKKGDLDGALAVRKEREKLQVLSELPSGRWELNYRTKKIIYQINGLKVYRDDGDEVFGTIKLLSGGLVLHHRSDGEKEQWTPLVDGRFCVEWFAANSNTAAGFGVMSKLPK